MQSLWQWEIKRRMTEKVLWSIELCYLAVCTSSDVKTGMISVRLSIGCGLCGIGIKVLAALAEGNGLSAIMVSDWMTDVMPGLAAMLAAGISHGAFGMGDAWMILVSCILSGGLEGCQMLWRAFVLGGIYGAWNLFRKKKCRTDTFPFAPYMLAAHMLRICGC